MKLSPTQRDVIMRMRADARIEYHGGTQMYLISNPWQNLRRDVLHALLKNGYIEDVGSYVYELTELGRTCEL